VARYELATGRVNIAQVARDAIEVQDACNLSGVAHLLVDACAAIRADDPTLGNPGLHSHPIVVLIVDKLVSLTTGDFLDAWPECARIAKGEAAG
jgi:hypothetical protein